MTLHSAEVLSQHCRVKSCETMRLAFGFSLKNPGDALDSCVPCHKNAVTVTLINALRVRADHSDLDSTERFAIDNSPKQSKFEAGISGVVVFCWIGRRSDQ